MIFINFLLKTLGFLFGLTLFIVILTILFGLLGSFSNQSNFRYISGDVSSKNIITIINLNGVILNNSEDLIYYPKIISTKKIIRLFNELDKLKPSAIIIKINSPGGTVSASLEIYEIIKKYKEKFGIKVYFFTDQLMTSGAYLVANSGDKIFASRGSLIGSIGVSSPSWIYYDKPKSISSGLFGQTIETKNEIKIFSQNAGQSKDLYNQFREPTKKELNHLKNIVENIYDDFIKIVEQNRKIENEELRNKIGALIFNSKMAKKNFLIDHILSNQDLIAHVTQDLKFNDYKILENTRDLNFFDRYLNIFKKNDLSFVCSNIKSNINSISPTYISSC